MIRTALTAVALLLAAVPGTASGATFKVTRTDDPQPGACSAGSCSLREAVDAANANGAGDDTVQLGAGSFKLNRGELASRGNLTLIGASARSTTIDPSPSRAESRTLHVTGGGVTVNVGGLTITGGDLEQGSGGGIFLEQPSSTLNLFYVAINSNKAFHGAGIRADGALNILGSTIFNNQALGIDKGDGPGIALFGSGHGTIVNTTLVANHGPDRGGAIEYSPQTPGTLALVNTTIADNHADHTGGGIAVGSNGRIYLGNTIIARNTVNTGGAGPNCQGRVYSFGYNIEGSSPPRSLQTVGGNTCGLHAAGDLSNTEPRLGRTQDNGGPTDTRELLSDSPAIDAGADAGCPGADQRGVTRPQGGSCDIGAFELAQAGGRGAPRLSGVRVTRRMRRGRGFFSYTLSEDARVSITLHRGLKGRRSGRRCVKRTRANRGKRSCLRYKRTGKFAQRGKQGPNRKRFKGKIRRRRLPAGFYRATLVAKNVSGVESRHVQARFRVTR